MENSLLETPVISYKEFRKYLENNPDKIFYRQDAEESPLAHYLASKYPEYKWRIDGISESNENCYAYTRERTSPSKLDQEILPEWAVIFSINFDATESIELYKRTGVESLKVLDRKPLIDEIDRDEFVQYLQSLNPEHSFKIYNRLTNLLASYLAYKYHTSDNEVVVGISICSYSAYHKGRCIVQERTPNWAREFINKIHEFDPMTGNITDKATVTAAMAIECMKGISNDV